MAKFSEIPVFVPGEPGFAAKLNQLGTVMAEVTAAFDALSAAVEELRGQVTKPATAPKTTARKAATTK